MQQILENYLIKALSEQNQRRTAKSLGNRSLYIGASDIAGSFGCERRVVLNKAIPEDEGEVTCKSIIARERGHWVEAGIGKALASKIPNSLFNVSIGFTTEAGTPVQIHPDFIVMGKEKIILFEVKSAKEIPSTPKVDHQAQAQCQISALKKKWSTPSFSMGEIKNVTFPMLAYMAVGKEYDNTPPEIEGYVLYISPDDLKLSSPILPNDAFWDVLLKRADSLWQKVQAPEQGLKAAQGIYLLCDYCRHISDCPNFASTDAVKGVQERVITLKEIAAQKKELEAEENTLKDELKSFASSGGLMGLWLEDNGYKVKVAMQPGRRSLDDDLLRQKLEQDYGLAPEAIDKLFGDCTSFGDPFMRVNTHEPKEEKPKVKKEKKAKAESAPLPMSEKAPEKAA